MSFSWSSFLTELKRRKVVRAGVTYAGATFVLLQAADLILPTIGLGHWFLPLLVATLIGMPVVLLLAWLYEWKHGRLTRTAAPAGTSQRMRRYAIALVLAMGIAASTFLGALAMLRPLAGTRQTHLAVLPLTAVAGTPEYLSVGMADLLTRALDGAGTLRTIPAELVRETVDREPARREDTWFEALPEELDVSAYVTGSVHTAGGRIRVDVAWHERQGADSVRTWRASASADTAELFQVVDGIARQLLEQRFARGASETPVRVAARTTTSLAALKEFLVAEEALRRGRFNDAIAGFERAIEADSTFAAARYRLAVATANAFGAGTSQQAAWRLAARAVEHADRLPERDQRLARALLAYRAGEADRAEALYRDVLEEYPRDLEAVFGLANVLGLHNGSRGRDPDEALPYFDLLIEHDPDFMCPI